MSNWWNNNNKNNGHNGGKSGKGTKTTNPANGGGGGWDSNEYESNYSNSKQSQMQSQKQIQGQTRVQTVVKSQLLFDQMDNCFAVLDRLKYEAKTNPNRSEIAGYCSAAVGSINIFGKMCKRQNNFGNQRGLDLASYRLMAYCSKIKDENDRKLLFPFVTYLQCAINGDDISIIPPLKTNDNDWNDDVGNNFMTQYLGKQHVIDDKVTKYTENYKDLENQYDNIWKQNNKKGVKFIENAKQPKPEQFYLAANINKNDIDHNMKSDDKPLGLHNDIFPEDDDHPNDHNDHNHQKKKTKNKGYSNNNNNNKNSNKNSKYY